MFTLAGVHRFEQDIKRSRFRAVAGPVQDAEEARQFFMAHGDAGAGHNCWAFRAGSVYRFNDDGEPGGSAGKPILQAIDGQGLDHVAVLVSRWFGGVLLGTGGLVRAYGGTAATCLREAERVEIVPTTTVRIVCAFAEAGRIRARLDTIAGARVDDEEFMPGGVRIVVIMPVTVSDAFIRMVTDITRGHAVIDQAEG
ncbi:IMPACT family protein [Pseudochelatococcus contaminans]|uniref:Putative IMPACT (Imprinted ancient) family translation regulator n=1 Tax=Pseudochelatococcus contaminans TaxID=1538103 RepID=A0A7W5Z449_9HYPH|nr:YigZ family protein [Pseudochelatococcus contaminans]MBB3809757.1 putative IMPACT (imprinted ancient) family translation regulator [Pseudochelatococcus contaminans]